MSNGSIYLPSPEIAKKVTSQFGSPLFITHKGTLNHRVALFREAFKGAKIYYAIKANYNPSLVKALKDAGVDGIDCVSQYEVEMAKKIGFKCHQILFTGNNSSDAEIKNVYGQGVLLNLGSLSELQRFGTYFPRGDISIRLNPGVGKGEFESVTTGGEKSKFGIPVSELAKAHALIKRHRLNLVGLHCHIGSGYYETSTFTVAVKNILRVAKDFENLQFVNFGGGFGIRYHPDESMINLNDFWSSIQEPLSSFYKRIGRSVEVRFEPGKFLVGESTALLVKVTTVTPTKDIPFIGVDSGFNHLIRPALYGAYHHIVNLSNPASPLQKVNVVGNICESTDYLGKEVLVATPREGDILALLTAGSYGASMSSLYNLRPYAAEVLVSDEEVLLTRKRLHLEELLAGLGFC